MLQGPFEAEEDGGVDLACVVGDLEGNDEEGMIYDCKSSCVLSATVKV